MKKILLCCCAMILGMCVAIISPALAADSTSPAPATDSNRTEVAGECVAEGFFVNPNDCKKFYRCVDFGDGKFTKFDFDCGPGTIFDEELSTCNHPWAVNPNSKCYQGN
ncbi:chitin binding domain-containing protein [Nostoc sp. FACHB-973]|nr:chitin binding domain-containing protein [Nostoc sp. FACHB-973]MBX9257371.1 chitin binding domain-containing protein [Desmonostoc muscorum CCALA 125]